MSASGKTALLVISPQNFRDEELNHPREILIKAGVLVSIVSTNRGEATGMLGHVEQVDQSLDDVAGNNYDAIVIIGGSGSPTHLWENTRLIEMVNRHHSLDKIVASICLSGVVLARAGILKGVTSTVYKNETSLKEFRSCGAKYTNQPVVIDGKVITASGPAAAREFGQALTLALAG